jgi:hypothetical protein
MSAAQRRPLPVFGEGGRERQRAAGWGVLCDKAQSPPDVALSTHNFESDSEQPPSFSRRDAPEWVFSSMRVRKKPEGRAGRREVRWIRGISGNKTRKSAFSPASRARCLRLSSAAPPVAQVSIHRFELWQRLAVWHGVTALPAKESGDAIRGAGTLQLQPPRFGRACCTRARPPLSGSA